MSVLFLGANFGVSQLDISPESFSFLNIVTALTACILAPLAVMLGVVGFIKKNDSRLISGIALALVGAPFLILFMQMLFSIARSN
ncbi:MAG: hypothetical protein HY864_08680 [Chloroflexi bacterium]|nr:hypothetical protein [Chloroflexota bacterium]